MNSAKLMLLGFGGREGSSAPSIGGLTSGGLSGLVEVEVVLLLLLPDAPSLFPHPLQNTQPKWQNLPQLCQYIFPVQNLMVEKNRDDRTRKARQKNAKACSEPRLNPSLFFIFIIACVVW